MARIGGLGMIDLMVTLAVATLLLGIGLPAMTKLVAETRVVTRSNLVLGHLQYARHAAVVHRRPVIACPSTDQLRCNGSNRWDQGWIIFIDENNRGRPASPADILRVVAPEPALLMHSAGRTRVRFLPSGGAFGSNLSIRICDQRGRTPARAVIVSNPGRARVSTEVPAQQCLI